MVVRLIVFGAALAVACEGPRLVCDGAAAARNSGPWELGIQAPDSVSQGDSLALALILRNIGDSALDPVLGEGNADFVVKPAGDTGEIWSKLHGAQVLSLLLRKGAIAPGDSVSIKHKWDQVGNDRKPLRPGVYCVSGNLRRSRGLNSLRTETATLRVLR